MNIRYKTNFKPTMKIQKEEILQHLESYFEDMILAVMTRQIGKILDFPLTVKQVASLTGRSKHNIYKMCQRDKLPYTKVGKTVLISLRDITSVLYTELDSE